MKRKRNTELLEIRWQQFQNLTFFSPRSKYCFLQKIRILKRNKEIRQLEADLEIKLKKLPETLQEVIPSFFSIRWSIFFLYSILCFRRIAGKCFSLTWTIIIADTFQIAEYREDLERTEKDLAMNQSDAINSTREIEMRTVELRSMEVCINGFQKMLLYWIIVLQKKRDERVKKVDDLVHKIEQRDIKIQSLFRKVISFTPVSWFASGFLVRW